MWSPKIFFTVFSIMFFLLFIIFSQFGDNAIVISLESKLSSSACWESNILVDGNSNLARINSHLSFKLFGLGSFWLVSEILLIVSFLDSLEFPNFSSFFACNSVRFVLSLMLELLTLSEIFSWLNISLFLMTASFFWVALFWFSWLLLKRFMFWLSKRPVKCISSQSLGLSLVLIWNSIFLKLLCQLTINDLFIVFEILSNSSCNSSEV